MDSPLTKQQMTLPTWLKVLNAEVVNCKRCPRLVLYREAIAREKRRAYENRNIGGNPFPDLAIPGRAC